MAEFPGRKLALLIQAVDGEIQRLRSFSDDKIVPGDEERLVAFENLADDLADAYGIALRTESNLSPYEQLISPPS